MPAMPYRLMVPEQHLTSCIFASPHSGRDYSEAFLADTVLDEVTIRSSEDAFVDLLLESAPRHGAPLLVATKPRAFVDLNRAAEELDPAVIEGARTGGHNPRINSGLGVIPRVVAGARAIYRGKIPLAEAAARIDGYWHPYHRRLGDLIAENLQQFGEAILLDMHSMPHEALEAMSPIGVRRPQIVLGDRFGVSASKLIVDRIEAAFVSQGLRVSRNAPFAGAFVTQAYGRPAEGVHAVQIEIDRSLYMDEALVRPNRDFAPFQRLMGRVVAALADIGRGEMRVAAE